MSIESIEDTLNRVYDELSTDEDVNEEEIEVEEPVETEGGGGWVTRRRRG